MRAASLSFSSPAEWECCSHRLGGCCGSESGVSSTVMELSTQEIVENKPRKNRILDIYSILELDRAKMCASSIV